MGWRRSGPRWVVWVVLLLLCLSAGLLYAALTGRTRRGSTVVQRTPGAEVAAARGAEALVERHLDGVWVQTGEEAGRPRAVMIDNHVSGWPISGLAQARVVIEAPVEGGLPRFMAFFDGFSHIDKIGPVRSARPYFVDWALGWGAEYFHVGGSSEALEQIRRQVGSMADVDEMRTGNAFWRASDRTAPHNAYTSTDFMTTVEMRRSFVTSSSLVAWHMQDAASGTERGDVLTIRIPYGGSYNVRWRFDKTRNVYARSQASKPQIDADGSPVESENVIVIKTDARVLDRVGRLHVRTIGSGDALAYRDGKKFAIRWRRGVGEPLRFEGMDGAEYLLNRGRTWIEVTTDDQTFAGLER